MESMVVFWNGGEVYEAVAVLSLDMETLVRPSWGRWRSMLLEHSRYFVSDSVSAGSGGSKGP